MKLELRYLRAFTVVVENRSIGRAAQALGMAQPVLSRMIQAMEHDLGVPLFERLQYGVRLTAQGELLLPHAQFLVSEAANAIDELAAMRDLRQGTLRVGAVSSALRRQVPHAIGEVSRRYPGLAVLVLDGAADALLSAITNREIDVMIGAGVEANDEVVSIGEIDDGDRLGVVASADHPLAQREIVEGAELAAHRWVLSPRGAPVRASLEAMCERVGLPRPRPAIETISASSVKLLLAGTPHLAWLADEHYTAEAEAGILRRVNVRDFEHRRRFRVFKRRFGLLPFAARALVQELGLAHADGPG